MDKSLSWIKELSVKRKGTQTEQYIREKKIVETSQKKKKLTQAILEGKRETFW